MSGWLWSKVETAPFHQKLVTNNDKKKTKTVKMQYKCKIDVRQQKQNTNKHSSNLSSSNTRPLLNPF